MSDVLLLLLSDVYHSQQHGACESAPQEDHSRHSSAHSEGLSGEYLLSIFDNSITQLSVLPPVKIALLSGFPG